MTITGWLILFIGVSTFLCAFLWCAAAINRIDDDLNHDREISE